MTFDEYTKKWVQDTRAEDARAKDTRAKDTRAKESRAKISQRVDTRSKILLYINVCLHNILIFDLIHAVYMMINNSSSRENTAVTFILICHVIEWG